MRLFMPQFLEYRNDTAADRALDVETMDEAFAKLAALVNGNLDVSNLSKTAAFPNSAFLEPNAIVTFRGFHSMLTTPAAPSRIILGMIPALLNGISLVPIAVSGVIFYSAVPASTPVFTLYVGANVVASGTVTELESYVNSQSIPRTRTVNPGVWWKFGDSWDPLQNYEDEPPPTNTVKYKVFTNFFSGGTTPATGNMVYATFSPTVPDMQSYIDITFKVRHVA